MSRKGTRRLRSSIGDKSGAAGNMEDDTDIDQSKFADAAGIME